MKMMQYKKVIIRNETNAGYKCKTTYRRLITPEKNSFLLISRLIQIEVSDEKAINTFLDNGWIMIRTYKNSVIGKKEMMINDDSLMDVMAKLYTAPKPS